MLLILGGWALTNDFEKLQRWKETTEWAAQNGCPTFVELRNEEFYQVEELSAHVNFPDGEDE